MIIVFEWIFREVCDGGREDVCDFHVCESCCSYVVRESRVFRSSCEFSRAKVVNFTGYRVPESGSSRVFGRGNAYM